MGVQLVDSPLYLPDDFTKALDVWEGFIQVVHSMKCISLFRVPRSTVMLNDILNCVHVFGGNLGSLFCGQCHM